jgi:ABC-type sugar transport system permease subunit
MAGQSTPSMDAMSASPASKPKKRYSLREQDARIGWLLLAPSLVVILGVTLWPIISTFVLSFFNAPTGINQGRTFVGFGNYTDLLRDQTFWETIGRTLYFTVVSVGIEMLMGLGIAQLIHSHPYGWQFLRFSLIIPWAVPTIVNGAMWRWIYSADFGALNGLLMQLGLIKHYVAWLSLPDMAMNLVILADVWHTMPFVALILQSALATLPQELDEAASVDGANAFQRFWSIRLPMLRPAILVALIVRTVDAFRVFDIAYIITSGGPAFKTVTITYLTYLNSFSYGKQGTGAALSFLISIVTITMAILYIRFLYRPEEAE